VVEIRYVVRLDPREAVSRPPGKLDYRRQEQYVQIKTRVAGVLATSAAAIAIMGGPAFASDNPIVGNTVGNGNISILSGNNVQIPVLVPVDICGTAVGLLGLANASCQGGAAAFLDSLNS
jgi:hypothetical protein